MFALVMLAWLLAGLCSQAIFRAPMSDRSPVDLVLSPDGEWLITANQTSHTLSLVRTSGR